MTDAIIDLDELPRRVRRVENVWIPMLDGARLAARMWLPEDAEERPVPAILEYIPYRKRDMTRSRDEQMHAFFAGHGYAAVRVDLRGSGESDGVLEDEYLQRELDDGVAVIEHLARQPWCTGAVGVIGKSWGGFNGLQLAALAPEPLKAVISVCSTDDRYADDVHHMGGCLLGDNLSWGSVMFAYNSMPPDPEIVGERWRDMWHERLEGSGLWLEKWLRHQLRDDYWKHGSICEDFSRVKAPVLAVSGWADGYSNAVFRLLKGLRGPRMGLIGPWGHKYPHQGVPGPAIDFLGEAVRWWDEHLKGEDTGIMQEPMLRVWMQESMAPTTSYSHRPGRWVGEPAWPSPNIERRQHPLGDRVIGDTDHRPAETSRFVVHSPLTVGLFAGKWCSYTGAPDLPGDQRHEDGGALVFDSAPLDEPLEILGSPMVEIELESDEPVATLAVRLSDVHPDGRATRVTYGLLNLTHRESSEAPSPLEPGRRYRVRVRLNEVAQQFPAGHRLRVAVSSSYWPIAWPPPRAATLIIYGGVSTLDLPVRAPRPDDERALGFGPPRHPPPPPTRRVREERHRWRVHHDLAAHEAELEVIKDEGVVYLSDVDLELERSTTERYSSRQDEFDSARGEVYAKWGMQRGDWHAWTETRTVLTSSESDFHVHATLDAYEGERRVFSRTWNLAIPRVLV